MEKPNLDMDQRSPMLELDMMDDAVHAQGVDEMKTMFDAGTHPKPPHPKEEGVTDLSGRRTVDMMRDTGPIESELGMVDLQPSELDDLSLD